MSKFKLEPVLSHRNLIEENLKKELAEFKKLFGSERNKLRAYFSYRGRLIGELEQMQEDGIVASTLILYTRYITCLESDITKQKIKLTETKHLLSNKTKELVEAMRDRKMIEKLKEKRLKLFKQEIIRTEQDFMDEVAVNGFKRSNDAWQL